MNKISKYEKLIHQVLKNISNQRTRDIVHLRFGLKDGQRKTLEAIGQKYGITRERVRQIEEAAFSDLRKPVLINILKPCFYSIDNFLNKQGRIVKEDRLLSSLAKTDSLCPAKGALFLILTLGEPYKRFVESDKFHALWTNSQEALDQADKLINQLVKKLEKDRKPASFDYVLSFFKDNLPKKALCSYLDVTKQIDQNSFGQFGLIKWAEINPRGAKDKAYLVLKKQEKPLHFREVADLINQAGLGPNLAQAQTVHNELIKDGRFVLVGRGTYALREWGFQPGTVKDAIAQALKGNDSLSKDEILDQVLKTRLVKKNTVLINLQNKKHFVKNKDGQYRLVR